MTIDVSLFWILVVLTAVLTVITVILWMGRSGANQTIASMSETIALAGKENASLKHIQKMNEATIANQEATIAERDTALTVTRAMVAALSAAAEADRLRLAQALTDGGTVFSVVGSALAFQQNTLEDVINVLIDLEVGESQFITGCVNAYLTWPGEAVEPEDYTADMAQRERMVFDAIGLSRNTPTVGLTETEVTHEGHVH